MESQSQYQKEKEVEMTPVEVVIQVSESKDEKVVVTDQISTSPDKLPIVVAVSKLPEPSDPNKLQKLADEVDKCLTEFSNLSNLSAIDATKFVPLPLFARLHFLLDQVKQEIKVAPMETSTSTKLSDDFNPLSWCTRAPQTRARILVAMESWNSTYISYKLRTLIATATVPKCDSNGTPSMMSVEESIEQYHLFKPTNEIQAEIDKMLESLDYTLFIPTPGELAAEAKRVATEALSRKRIVQGFTVTISTLLIVAIVLIVYFNAFYPSTK